MTPQQRKVFAFLRAGLVAKEIACEMNIATATVQYHVREIYLRLGVHNRAELMRVDEPAEPYLEKLAATLRAKGWTVTPPLHKHVWENDLCACGIARCPNHPHLCLYGHANAACPICENST